jgi:DNA polymerase III subunit delta
MAADELQPVYLLTGTDRPKIVRALRRLRGRFPEESIETLTAPPTTGEDAVAACNALGLFADGGRLVVVEGVETWRAAEVESVSAYVADSSPGAVLALWAHEPPKSGALAEVVAKHGKVLAFDVPRPRSPSAWVAGEFKRLGVEVDADAARLLVDIVGDDVLTLASEIEKIATWAAGQPVGTREIEAMAVPAREVEAWAVTDAWGARDLPAAMAACEASLEQREPFSIAVSLASHVGRVRAAQLLAEEGLGTREIAKRLGLRSEFPARKALSHSENYSREELDAAIVRLAELDAAIKGASRLSAELELERAITDVTRARQQTTIAERS